MNHLKIIHGLSMHDPLIIHGNQWITFWTVKECLWTVHGMSTDNPETKRGGESNT